jgi:hypothetical protein
MGLDRRRRDRLGSPLPEVSFHERNVLITEVGSVEGVEAAIRDGEPGPFHVDEISSEPLPSGHTSRQWGTAIKRPDGAVTLDPDPWPDR